MTTCAGCDFCFECTRCHSRYCSEHDPTETIDGHAHCEACAVAAIEEHRPEIEEFAAELRLTTKLHRFDPSLRFAPTRTEYEDGAREAYTENSVRAYNRHNCTNYDELIGGLDRYDALDEAVYTAVRERVERLLDDATDEDYEPDGAEDAE